MTKTAKAKTARAPKTTERAPRATPGLRRLRKAANAETIRADVLADQTNGRAEAAAKIKAKRRAAQTPEDGDLPVPAPDAPADAAAPATAAAAPFNDEPALTMTGFKRGVAVPPTPVPTPAESMPGMSRANAAIYLAAAAGQMPTPPDFSKPSYAPDRNRLAELVALAQAGDVAALRGYAIKVYYSAALELDRYRHRAILAIEARQAQAAAAILTHH